MKSSLKAIFTALIAAAVMFTGLSTAAQAEATTYEHTFSCATLGTLRINVPATATDVKFNFEADCTDWGVMGGNSNGMFVNYTGSGTGVTPTSTFAGNWFGPITNAGNDAWITGTLMETANNGTLTYGLNQNLVILYNGSSYIFVALGSQDPDEEEPTPLSGEIGAVKFPGNNAWLKKAVKNNLRKLADQIAASTSREIEVTGYAPVLKLGKKAPNYKAIALARANAVAKFLTKAFAYRDVEVTITVKAEAAPKALRKSYDFLAANRKVTISVSEIPN